MAAIHRKNNGSALVYCILLMTVLLGFASLVVDYAMVQLVRTQLRTAVDAASIAGSGGLSVSPAEARTRAKEIAAANLVNGQPMTLLDSDIELGTWDSATKTFTVLSGASEANANALRVTGRLRRDRTTQVRLSFLPLIGGSDAVEPTSASVCGVGMGSVDVVVVQDISTSFVDEMPDAKAGNLALLNALNTPNTRSNFGLVGFSGWGQTFSPLRSIASYYSTLTSAINSLNVAGTPGMQAPSGTDIAAGIEQAQSLFNTFSSSTSATKAMIIVSDGDPSVWYDAKHPHPYYNNSSLLRLAQRDADTAWAQQIHVYVVFFNRNNDVSAANRLRTLIRGQGTFVQVTDPAQLPTAIGQIAKQMPGTWVN